MIDPILQEQLRAKYNPDGSDLRKMQLRMLDMLKYIDKICRENNIKYWLSSGTCLGAVRHGGFIPWDDDCDIEVSYEDTNRLVKILKQNQDKYVLQEIDTDPNYVHAFSKLRDLNSYVKENNISDKWNKYNGIFVDIFSMEPSGSKLIFKICGALWGKMVYRCSSIDNTRIRHTINRFSRFLLKNILFTFIRPFYRINSKGQLRHKLGGMFPKCRYNEDISEVIYVKFEDTFLPIPHKYDHYLNSIYGDYMSLPSIEKIGSHNVCVKIWDN